MESKNVACVYCNLAWDTQFFNLNFCYPIIGTTHKSKASTKN